MTRQNYMRGIFIWFVAVLFYLYQYLLRVSPGVMASDLMLDFSLDARSFANLAAVATYCYALLQIPSGMLSDLYGARKMILWSLFACVAGIGLFTYTSDLFLAYVGRILIGAGSAAAFISVSKITSDWFPVSHKSMWFAMTVTMGTLGAILGLQPLALMVDAYGWRDTLYILTIAGVVVYVLNLIFLRNKMDTSGREVVIDKKKTYQQVMAVFRSRFCWMYAIVALGMYLSVSVFADLWGVSFLVMKYGVTRDAAALAVSKIYMGTCVGVITVAAISQLLKDARYVIGVTALMVTILMSIIVYADSISFSTASICMIIVGVCVGGEVLCFSTACQQMSISVAATVTGFLNFIVVLGAAVVQQLVGRALKFFTNGHLDEAGQPLYTVLDYQAALAIVIVISLSSFILAFFLPKNNPDYVPEVE